jgi:transcriptional accessory protein Tex/SPT6
MSASNDGKVAQCEPLASELHNMDQLEEAVAKVPIRGIIGTVRNVADFGAFIDIGCENDGLLHISKLGTSLQLSQLLIGQQVGVDILSASKGRISLGLHGCRLSPSQPRSFDGTRNGKSNAGASGGKKRPMSTMSGGARKKPMTRDVKREKR